MSKIPEWALRAAEFQEGPHESTCSLDITESVNCGSCNCGRAVRVMVRAGGLVRVLGPEREEMEAERTNLLEQHAILGAKVEVAEAAARVAEGLLKHVTRERDELEDENKRLRHYTRCACLVDTPEDVCAHHSPAVQKAERERDEARKHAAEHHIEGGCMTCLAIETERNAAVAENERLAKLLNSWRDQAKMHAADALKYGRERDEARQIARYALNIMELTGSASKEWLDFQDPIPRVIGECDYTYPDGSYCGRPKYLHEKPPAPTTQDDAGQCLCDEAGWRHCPIHQEDGREERAEATAAPYEPSGAQARAASETSARETWGENGAGQKQAIEKSQGERIATCLDRVGDIAAAILDGLSPQDQEREVRKLEAAARPSRSPAPPQPNDAEAGGKDRYAEGFLAGQVVAYCEAIRRGSRVAAQLAFPKMYVAPLTRLIAREGCRSVVESVTSDHASVWIYRDRTVKRLIDRLASKPGSALDVWSMGKIFGYADRDVLEFIEREVRCD